MKTKIKYLLPIVMIVCLLFSFQTISHSDKSVDISGELMQWHKTVLTFTGPITSENANPNPFTDYRLDVTFSGPSGQTYRVPGFYAADGNAAESSASSGNKWRANFCPDEAGSWSYSVSFRKGTNIAAKFSGGSSAGSFDGETGDFTVVRTDKNPDGKDFRAKGILQYTGKHYFQFAGTKEYYLKGGADSPENFLAYKEIDNTYDADAGSGSYSHIGGFIHEY